MGKGIIQDHLVELYKEGSKHSRLARRNGGNGSLSARGNESSMVHQSKSAEAQDVANCFFPAFAY